MASSQFIGLSEFFKLVGKLKHLKRTGWVLKDISEPETVACHMYRMAIMSFIAGKGQNIDQIRVMKMCLVHDLGESLVGDITPHCGISIKDKHQSEVDAMTKIKNYLPGDVGTEIFSLFMEYEKQETPEAKLVKDLDKFDMVFQAYEYEMTKKSPGDLEEFFQSTKQSFTNPEILGWLTELNKLRSKDGTNS